MFSLRVAKLANDSAYLDAEVVTFMGINGIAL
jgi:hypothetical protein